MDPFVPDDEITRDGDLADWQAFSLAYYEPILRVLRLLRVPEGELEDLATRSSSSPRSGISWRSFGPSV